MTETPAQRFDITIPNFLKHTIKAFVYGEEKPVDRAEKSRSGPGAAGVCLRLGGRARRARPTVIKSAPEAGIDFLHVSAQQEFHHGRYDRAGEKIRRQHGENHRHGQWLKQISGGAAQKKNGHKHDANAQCRDKGGHGDLLRPIEDRADHWFPQGEVAMDVFNFYGCIIHQDANGQCEAAERHDV